MEKKKVLWICEKGKPPFPLEEIQRKLGDCTIIPVGVVESVNQAHKLVNQYLPDFVVSEIPLSTFVMFLELKWWPSIPLLRPVADMVWCDNEEPPRIRLLGFKRIVDVRWVEEDWEIEEHKRCCENGRYNEERGEIAGEDIRT